MTTPTNNTAKDNVLVNNAVASATTSPYQARIQAIGNSDIIASNDTCGPGYADNPPAMSAIDAALDTGAWVKHNTVCDTGHDHDHGHGHGHWF